MVYQQQLRGTDLLKDPNRNKGSAFTDAERDVLGLRGLLPPLLQTIEEQVLGVLAELRAIESSLDKHIFLIGLQERNRTLFYRLVIDHLEEIMPLIYTPTVGQACQEYGRIMRHPQGLFITEDDAGHVGEVLANWPQNDVRVIVVTDGERILGLGDLGAHGMGIPVGKLSLYTACAGIHPAETLPITLDVGTNNQHNRADSLYIGLRRERTRGEKYDAFVDEFVQAVKARYPHVLLQWEDFGNKNAFRLLEQYRTQLATFNDDIQGTAAVTLAGILSALRITRKSLAEQTFLFLGAGEAGVGIADLLVAALHEAGMPEAEARRRCWLVDSAGLVVASRNDLAPHKQAYAHAAPFVKTLLGAVEQVNPTVLIGVSGIPHTFDEAVVQAMTQRNERPIIFALSNPTSQSECTAEQAFNWSDGRAIFASGSPFNPVVYGGKTFIPGQANNSYVFPGIGLGVVVSRATQVTDEMFLTTAMTLAELVTEDDLQHGRIFPPLTQIRTISAHIAAAIWESAAEAGVAREALPRDVVAYIRQQMYEPVYASYV